MTFKKNLKILTGILILSMLMLTVAGCGGGAEQQVPDNSGQAEENKPIRIGALFPFTGNLAMLGEESFRGAEIAAEEINANGGINGRKIEFVKGDAVDAKQAVAEAERLITVEGVDIITGTYSSSLAYAASEVAERNGIIYWELGAVADDITTRGFQYLFRVAPRAQQYGFTGVEFAHDILAPKLGINPENLKLGIIFEDGLYGTTVAKFAKQRAEELGMPIVIYEAYSTKSVDLSSLIMQLKQAEPDVVLAVQYLTDLLLYWNQSKELNFNTKALIGMGGAHSNDEFPEAVGNVDGVMNVGFGSTGVNRAYAPGLDDFLAKYKEKYGRDATSVYPAVNYVGAKVLFDVIGKAGGTNPDKVREAALTIDIPTESTEAGWGVKFSGSDAPDAGQNQRGQMIVDQWQEGERVVVYPNKARPEGIEVLAPLPTWEQRSQ